jgi:hypothetical protein
LTIFNHDVPLSAAILKRPAAKRRPQSPEGWQGQKRMRTLDRSPEGASGAASVFVASDLWSHRTPGNFFRRLFVFLDYPNSELPQFCQPFSKGNLTIFYHNDLPFGGNSETSGGKKTPTKPGGVTGVYQNTDT